MDFHGYYTGDPNNWYQSRPDLREPAAEYGGNYHGCHFYDYSPSLHLHQSPNPPPWASSPIPVSETYPYPSFYHYSSPPLSNHTIINGHSLPLQFPFRSSISQPMNPQPSPATYYPPYQPYSPYVCLPTQQFHSPPSVLPTKTTTTPPIYQANRIPLGLVTPAEPEPQFSDPNSPTTLLCVVNSEPSPDSLADLGHQSEVPEAALDGIDHSSPELLDDLIHHWANVTAVDVTVDGEIELQSVGTLNRELKMQFPAIDDEKLSTRLDKLERGFDETCKRDAGRDLRRNSDEKVQSKESGAIVDFPLVRDSANSSQEIDNCVIKVYDRYDTLDNIELDEFCKELELGIRICTVLVYQYCKLGLFDKAKRLLCEVIKLCFTPTPIVGNTFLLGYNSGQENLSTGDRFENFKVDSDMMLAKIWVRWKSEVAAGNTVEEGAKELNMEFTNITMDCLENILGCNIDLTNDKDALWSAQRQIVCSSLPTAWVLSTQSSCQNIRRILESHFRCPNLYEIRIYEVVTKVTIFGVVDYSSSRFILFSQNYFQVTILSSKSKYALLRLQFAVSYVTLELLFVYFDNGSMFVDNATKARGDALLECNHWIVEWATDKSGWEELLKYYSKFNQHVLVRNVIAHAQLNVEILLDEMGHTRILGLHVFLDEVDFRYLGLDLAIKYENHRRLSNKHFRLVLRYAITSIPKCRTFLKDFVTSKGTLLKVFTILFSALGLVEIQNHNFSSSESRIIQCIMWISVIMEFADNIATTIQEVTSLRLLTVHLVSLLFALLKCHLGVKLESARHNSLVLKFLKAMILFCAHTLYEIQACVLLELLQLVGFFFNGDRHWTVLQRFMEFKLMIRGKDTTSELTIWQDAVVKNHQRYLGKLNARYVALLTLREVISVEEFGQTVRFGVSTEEITDFPKIISEFYAFWVFEVDKEVVLATLGVIQVMYLLPLEHQKELREQVVAEKEVSNFQGLLQVHYLLKGYPQIGFDGNREREENAKLLLHNVHLFVALYSIRVTIVGMLYTIVADVLCVFCSLTNGEANSIAISWKSKLTGYSLCPIATQASTEVLLWTRASFLSWTLSSGCCKYVLSLAGVYMDTIQGILINHAEYSLVVWNNIMASYFFTEHYTNQVGMALTFDENNILPKSMEITKLVCDGDDLLHYFLQWGITLLILYLGFISLRSVHECSWYNILRISFDNIMALKVVSVIRSGILLKTIAMDLQGMRTCLISRGRDC